MSTHNLWRFAQYNLPYQCRIDAGYGAHACGDVIPANTLLAEPEDWPAVSLCLSCIGLYVAPLALGAGAPSPDDESDEGEVTLRDWLDAQVTREQWLLERVIVDLNPIFTNAGYTLPDIRVSCGWTGVGQEGCTLGICFHTEASAAKVNEIFVSPAIDDPALVLAVLMHEMAHAVAGVQHQHDAKYVEVCKAVGLTQDLPNQASPGAALKRHLARIARTCDAYPHAKVNPPPPSPGGGGGGKQEQDTPPKESKPQSTRLLKADCGTCGYTIRLTMKWASKGLPACPCCKALLTLADGGGA